MSSSLVGVSMKSAAKDQKSASNGVGSKNWNKAIALLAKSEDTKASTSTSSSSFFGKDKDSKSAGESDASIQDMELDVPPQKRTGKLRSYSETRFRLAEKAMKIANARTVPIVQSGIDGEGATSAVALAMEVSHDSKASDSESGASNTSSTSAQPSKKPNTFPRPFRRTDRPSRSLIDQATMLSKDLEYNLWNLAGSEADSVKDRVVVSLLSCGCGRGNQGIN